MVNKTIIAVACAFIASPAFAQPSYYRATGPMTTSERVIVTAPIIAAQEGSAATYQPNGTLVVRTDSANPERFDTIGPALVYDKFGRAVRGPIKPGSRVVVFYTSDGYARLIDHVLVLD